VEHRTLLTRLNEPDDAVEARMISALDALLLNPPRKKLAAGEMVFRQNDPMTDIYILVSGQVKLYQEMDGREVIFHAQTSGRILGLLALTRRSLAFFNCRTLTPVELMQIPFEDLDRALQQSDSLLVAFITVLMRSMARRSTRLVELQTEVLALNKSLSRERDALAHALMELQQAQGLLVESEKMATLGQLAAGVAHELNNPIAAISRAADFIREDLLALSAELPDGALFEAMLKRALTLNVLPTKEQRERRRTLAKELGDAEMAEELVGMGVYTPAEYRELQALAPGQLTDTLAPMRRYYQIGGALRNISTCSGRIAELVKSLRSYSRADDSEAREIDIHEGLEDTLRLFSNRLRNVRVERHYAALPPIAVHAGPINQVWTNLIANALDAMKDEGNLTIETDLHGSSRSIMVRIIDSGPGIPPEHLKRIFDLRFTTREGRVEFGLGLGLSISQNIVARHGGCIDVQSEPGRTVFTVCLPLTVSRIISNPERSSDNE
jgi:two-component system, NtrC family, sensor kinase